MLSKIIDKRMKKYGYKKTIENYYRASYVKHEKSGDYDHVIALLHKPRGKHMLQSFSLKCEEISSTWGNEGAGIEIPVLLLMWLKTKQMARKYRWGKGGAR